MTTIEIRKFISKRIKFNKVVFWILYILFVCFMIPCSIEQIRQIAILEKNAPPEVWIIDGVEYTEDEPIRYSFNSEGEKR